MVAHPARLLQRPPRYKQKDSKRPKADIRQLSHRRHPYRSSLIVKMSVTADLLGPATPSGRQAIAQVRICLRTRFLAPNDDSIAKNDNRGVCRGRPWT